MKILQNENIKKATDKLLEMIENMKTTSNPVHKIDKSIVNDVQNAIKQIDDIIYDLVK